MVLGQVMKRTRRCRTARQRKTPEAPPPLPLFIFKIRTFFADHFIGTEVSMEKLDLKKQWKQLYQPMA